MADQKTSKRSPNDRDKIIGRRIRSYREIAGLNQSELADIVGVTFQQIQKYEYGTNKVSVGRMLEICDALKVSAVNFLQGLTDLTPSDAPPAMVSDKAQETLDNDPMSSKETIELLRVYYSIKDPKKRKAVVKFIKDSMTD
jgi:transcriptional regulator with XRE-family HTH domain